MEKMRRLEEFDTQEEIDNYLKETGGFYLDIVTGRVTSIEIEREKERRAYGEDWNEKLNEIKRRIEVLKLSYRARYQLAIQRAVRNGLTFNEYYDIDVFEEAEKTGKPVAWFAPDHVRETIWIKDRLYKVVVGDEQNIDQLLECEELIFIVENGAGDVLKEAFEYYRIEVDHRVKEEMVNVVFKNKRPDTEDDADEELNNLAFDLDEKQPS